MSEHPIQDTLKGAMDQWDHAFYESESLVERTIYQNRLWVLLVFLLVTVYLVSAAIKVRPDASFEKMVPIKHPYIAAYLERKDELTGLGNAVRISIETTEGDILTKEYMETLRQMVAANVGITLLPILAVKPPIAQTENLVTREFPDPPPSRNIALVWRNSSALSGFLKEFADSFRQLPNDLFRL